MGRIYRIHMKSVARPMLSSTVAIQPLSVLALLVHEEEDAVWFEVKLTHYRKIT